MEIKYMGNSKVRHIIGISGGKDSTALAIYLRDKVENLEYIFCDTGKELPEVYEYINRIEAFLGIKIVRLPQEIDGVRNDFDHFLKIYGGFLPSPQARWCTRKMKLEPFEKYIGNSSVINYVGIRYDELDRLGYMPHKYNVKTIFPFRENKIDYDGVLRILNESGIGIPEYYKWRSRSGCFFCFFQRPSEWIGLYKNHPDLFKEAMKYEKTDNITGKYFTWRQEESLNDMLKPHRMEQIINLSKDNHTRQRNRLSGRPLIEVLEEARDEEDYREPCLICHL